MKVLVYNQRRGCSIFRPQAHELIGKRLSSQNMGNWDEFDFDHLMSVAKTSPQQFAVERERLIRQLLDQASNRCDSYAMQMAIDTDRYACGLGIQASLHSLEMTLDSVELLSRAILELNRSISACMPVNTSLNNIHSTTSSQGKE